MVGESVSETSHTKNTFGNKLLLLPSVKQTLNKLKHKEEE